MQPLCDGGPLIGVCFASMSENPMGLVAQARALLSFQGDLGLHGVDVPFEILTRRAPAEPPRPATDVVDMGPPTAGNEAMVQPRGSLGGIREEIGDCRRCKLSDRRTNIVFGAGYHKARLMFVGEGPGQDEDLQGEPFVGAAGKLLDKMIRAMTLERSEVYIANIVKCRPPRNRDPEPDEVAACEPFLKQQIAVVQPEVIVALGRCAAQTLLRDQTAISRLRGKWREYEGRALMPTFHPAYLLRNASEKKWVWHDLQEVMRRLGLNLPKST